MTMSAWLLLTVGVAVLVLGAELLVRGASTLAVRLGMSPLVIGLTIVAFGTSSPEVAVSLKATADRQPDLVLGNAVGSNTFNVLFILGLSALIRPLVVHQKLIRLDIPLMIGTGLLLWLLLADRSLGRLDAALLLTGIIAYTATAIRSAKREQPDVEKEYAEAVPAAPRSGLTLAITFITGGLVLAVLGARWLVSGAVSIASSLGVSELIIGLTIVAAGTSLPEVATSVVAALRGQRDIAVGNVVGSNIFNMLAVPGLCGIVAPEGVAASPKLLAFDLPVMIAVSAACLPIAFTGSEIRRWEGGLFLAYYGGYILYLLLDASGHAARSTFVAALFWFVLPLSALGITVSVVTQLRRSWTRRHA
jgi:cation:H+ antiporter